MNEESRGIWVNRESISLVCSKCGNRHTYRSQEIGKLVNAQYEEWAAANERWAAAYDARERARNKVLSHKAVSAAALARYTKNAEAIRQAKVLRRRLLSAAAALGRLLP